MHIQESRLVRSSRRVLSSRLSWLLAGGGVGLAVCGVVRPAHAQDSLEGEFSVQRFDPAPGPRNFITGRSARSNGEMAFSAALLANYAYQPFVVLSCESSTDCDSPNATNPEDLQVVENLVTADVMGTLTPIPPLQIGLRIPVTYAKGQGLTENGVSSEEGLSAVGMGDMLLEGKYRFYGEVASPFAFAGALFLTAPLGSATAKDSYIGDSSPNVGLRAIADAKFGPAMVGANLIGLYRKTGRVGTTEIGSEFRYDVAGAYEFSPLFSAVLDLFGSTKFSGDAGTNALEALLGAKISVAPGMSITAGGGTGLIKGVGVPSVRAFLGFMYVSEAADRDGDGLLDAADACPTVAEDKDGVQDGDGCPDLDNDDDQIADAADKCPDQAEDPDDFEDQDGCPEADNDKDGVPDEGDICKNEPETKNGYKDNDGCPDEVDTDNDGVIDTKDKCPKDPEDTDGFQDEDGCTDPDNDADGVPDDKDECVDEAETVDGVDDQDGCPEEGVIDADAPAPKPAPAGAAPAAKPAAPADPY